MTDTRVRSRIRKLAVLTVILSAGIAFLASTCCTGTCTNGHWAANRDWAWSVLSGELYLNWDPCLTHFGCNIDPPRDPSECPWPGKDWGHSPVEEICCTAGDTVEFPAHWNDVDYYICDEGVQDSRDGGGSCTPVWSVERISGWGSTGSGTTDAVIAPTDQGAHLCPSNSWPCWTSIHHHTFPEVGTYKVKVTVTDHASDGNDESNETEKIVRVKPVAPQLPVDGSVTMGCGSGDSGCGCASGSCGAPSPSKAWPGVAAPLSAASKLKLPGVLPTNGEAPSGMAALGQSGGHDSCAESIQVYETCNGFYFIYISPCGIAMSSICALPVSPNQTAVSFSAGTTLISGTLNADRSATLTAKHIDGSISTFICPPPPPSTYTLSVGPSSVTGPNNNTGATTTIDYGLVDEASTYSPLNLQIGQDNDDEFSISGLPSLTAGQGDGPPEGSIYNLLTLPTGEQWRFYVDETKSKVTRVVAPDGAYVEVAYAGTSENGTGRITSVRANGDNNTIVSCTYDPDGRLATWTNGSAQTVYSYGGTGRSIEMVVQSASSPHPRFSRMVYDYGDLTSDTTAITRKKQLTAPTQGDDTDPEDQTTTYVFYGGLQTIGGNSTFVKTYVKSVTGPDGVTTLNDSIDGDGAPLTVKVTKVIGGQTQTLSQTDYVYNNAKAVTSIEKTMGSITSYETLTYYTDSGLNETIWLMDHHDARGSWTHYDRDPNDLSLVTAVKVSGPDPNGIPDWENIDPVKEYIYYGDSDTDGLSGQLKKEIIPDIEGTTDQETTYKYGQDGKYFGSPTQVVYKYYSGSAYVDEASYSYYDPMGRTIYTSDASGTSMATGKKVWHTYDGLGRPLKTIYAWQTAPASDDHPETGTPSVYTENHYDCCGMDWSQDENGRKTYYDYDEAKRVIKTWTEIAGQSESTPLVTYHYDNFGNQDFVTTCSGLDGSNPVNRVTAYTYDGSNRVTKIVYPCDASEGDLLWNDYYQYDDWGRLAAKLNGLVSGSTITAGKITAYQYDAAGRLSKVKYEYPSAVWPLAAAVNISGAGDVGYAYELIDSTDVGSTFRRSMTDSSGTSEYTYDTQGRLESYKPPVGLGSGFKVWYAYNLAGQKTDIEISDDPEEDPETLQHTPYHVHYDHFANGWLKDVKQNGSTVASYSYNAVGNRLTQTNGNGTSTEYAYATSDARYFLDSITHKHGTTTLATIGYTSTARDNAGNPKSMTDWTGTWTYDYDANNRLIGAVPPTPVPEQPAGGPYEYDWVGNRVRPPRDPGPNPPTNTNKMVYNEADQLLQWPGMHGADTTTHAGYVYYPDGSLQYERNAAGTDWMKSYSYTPDGLLFEANYDRTSSTDSTYLKNFWDADKNRVKYEVGSDNGTTHTTQYSHTFVYDTTAGIPAVIQEDGVYYIREPYGALVARKDGSNWSYYHFDELGSTRLLTKSTGVVTDKYAYDAYGALLAHEKLTGSVDQPYQYVGEIGYYAHWQESGLALLQIGVRSYDPAIGRFMQKDPVEQRGSDSYGYVNGRALSAVDPRGLFYCHRLRHFPWFWCWCGNPPKKRYKPLPIGKIPPIPGPIGKPIKYIKEWDTVKCACQDAADTADAAMACMGAVQNWFEEGTPDDTTDPIMKYLIDKYGADGLAQMGVMSSIDKCEKAMCGKGMGDLVKQWVKMYK